MIEAIGGLFSGGAASALLKTGGALLTTLLVVPAVLKLFIVTVEEGSAAIRTRNGKPIVRKRTTRRGAAGELVVLSPGSHAAFPIVAWYRLIDVRARATDLAARQLTAASGHQHLVHASFDWRPLPTGHDLRVFELGVVDVKERAGNIVGAALRDTVRRLDGATLPSNSVMSNLVTTACADEVRDRCGVELLGVTLNGDALTDGWLLADAVRGRNVDEATVVALQAVG